MVRSTTVIWISWPEQGGVDGAIVGKERHRSMSQVRLSALEYPSKKAWDLSVDQIGKGGVCAQKQQSWQQIVSDQSF